MKRFSLQVLTLAVVLSAPALAADSVSRVLDVGQSPVVGGGGATCPNGMPPLLAQAANQVNGLFADANCAACASGQQSIADDFVLSSGATVGQIVIWGGYFPTNAVPNPSDAFTIIFHSDAATLPGGVLDSQTLVPTSAVPTGVTLFGVSEIEYVFDISPVALGAGTYWVEIFTNSSGTTDQFFWETGNLDGANGRLNDAFAQATPGVAWITGNPAADNAIVFCEPGVVAPDESILAIPTLGTIGLVAMIGLLLAMGVVVMSRRRQNN